MSLREYRSLLGDHWRVWTAALAVGLLLAAVATVLVPVRYSSETALFFTAVRAPESLAGAYDGVQLAREKTADYAVLAGGDRLAEAVAARLGPDVDPGTLTGRITAAPETDAPLLTINATAASPQLAQAVARAAAEALAALVAELEQPATAGATAPVVEDVTTRVVQPATLEPRPVSLGPALMLLIGAGVGLLVGILAVVVRNAADGSLRTPTDVERDTGKPVLAVVPGTRRFARSRSGPADDRAEAVRRLHTALTYRAGAPLRGVLAVTGARAGEGRTGLVLDLARMIARGGRSVLVVDADLRHPQVAVRLGLDGHVGLSTLLSSTATLDDVRRHGGDGTFDVVVAGDVPPDPAEMLSSASVSALLEAARRRYDTVLVDTPPLGLVADAALVTRGDHSALFVVRAGHVDTEDVRRALALLSAVGTEIVGTVLTGDTSSSARARTSARPGRARDRAAPPVTGSPDAEEPPVASDSAVAPTDRPTGAPTPSQPLSILRVRTAVGERARGGEATTTTDGGAQ